MLKDVVMMKLLFDERARDVDGKSIEFQELVESIKAHGVLTPITVRENPEQQGTFILVCGARRVAAAMCVGLETIPANVINISDKTEHAICELEENIRRKNFTWQEEVIACGRLYQQIRAKDKTFTMTRMAEMLQKSKAKVSEDLDLYNHREQFPSVFAFSEISRAKEELRRCKVDTLAQEKVRRMQEAAKQDMQEENSEDFLEGPRTHETNTVPIQGAFSGVATSIFSSAIELLESLEDQSIDLICTDPPFGIEVQGGRRRKTQKAVYEEYTDSADDYFSIIEQCIPHFARVLKPGAHFYMFFGIQHYQELSDLLRQNNLFPHKVPLIWHRTGTGAAANQPYYYPASAYQAIFFGYAAGERRRLKIQGQSNVLTTPATPPQQKSHPLEVPVLVYRDLINRSAYPGDKMIDPFCGTGNSLLAALTCGCSVLGAEIRDDYRALATLQVEKGLKVQQAVSEHSEETGEFICPEII